MRSYTRSLGLALSFVSLVATGSVLAAGKNINGSCEGVEVYTFKHTSPNTHEQISCTAPDGVTVEFSNYAEMVKGFDKNGHLSIKSDELKKYYFDAYHDVDYVGQHGKLCTTTSGVVCYEGKHAPDEKKDRDLVPGDYGLHP